MPVHATRPALALVPTLVLTPAAASVPQADAAPPPACIPQRDTALTPGGSWWRQISAVWGRKRAENFRHMECIFPSRAIPMSTHPVPMAKAPQACPETFRLGGERRPVQQFLRDTRTQGLLVLRGNTVLHEQYGEGAGPDDRFASWSMSKSVTSLLIGIALDQGRIASIHDRVEAYVPELRGTAYGRATLRNLLQMRSGVRFSEHYDAPLSDVYTLMVHLYGLNRPLLNALKHRPAERPPGGPFAYKSSDTAVLGLVLQRAVGVPLSHYLQQVLWEPMGMQDAAFWMTDRHGQELAFCGIQATLRDYARIGQLLAQGGKMGGNRIVSPAWLAESIVPDDASLQPGVADSVMGYQYQWWVPLDPQGEAMAIGIYGQYIYVDIPRQIVIVKTSCDPNFDDRDADHIALFRTLAQQMSEQS